jgi:hypothetical protein
MFTHTFIMCAHTSLLFYFEFSMIINEILSEELAVRQDD